MAEVSPVVFEFHARTTKFRSDVRGTTNVVGSDLDRMEARFRANADRISSTMRGLGATLATALGAREISGLLDSYTRFQNALKVAGLEGETLAGVQERLFTLANRNGVALEAIGTLYGRAAQSADTLGASQEDLLKFTEAVSASLRITGTSTQEASGSLLQLGQALGSPRVQAEEFNSILDTMRPLLVEAAKEIDGTGGSLDGLIRRLKDAQGPGVSNIELFEGITGAMERLREQADSTALTLEAGFTNVSSALTKYFGEADQANGVSLALGAAMQTLADNLDILIPALAIIATSMGVQMVGSAIAGTNAMFALQAAMAGAATTTEALGFAMAGLGRALPFLAITAVVGALGYMALESRRASAEVAALKTEADRTAEEADAMEARLRAAGIETDNLGASAQTARSDMVDLTGGMEGARQKAAELGAQAVQTAKQLKQMRLQEILGEQQKITNARNSRRRSIRSQTRTGDALATSGDRTFREAEDARLADLNRIEGDLRRQIRGYEVGGVAALPSPPVPRPVSPVPSAGGTSGSASTPSASGPSAARQETRARAAYLSELDQLHADELRSRAELTGSIGDQLAAELARIDAETASFARQVSLDEELTAVERDKLITQQAQVAALRRQEASQSAKVAEVERQSRLLSDISQAEQNHLSSQLALTSDREGRARIEQAILDLQHEQERAELQGLLKTLELNGAKQDEIDSVRRRIELSAKAYANDTKSVQQANESPLQRYARDLNEKSLEDRAEELIVDEIETVRRGMRDAITDAIGTDDPLITGLLDILLQEVLFKPLADSLANARGGGGDFFGSLLSGIGSFFGGARATGGPVSAGKAYLVGERGPELMVPGASGTVIPNHAIAAANMPMAGGGAAAGGIATVRLELSGDLDARIDQRSTNVAVEVTRATAPRLIDAAANETARRFSRPKL